MAEPWWKESIVYQIYPRSFLDANGDGIGDLQGILRKLDYIRDLGADVIWLSPIYDSPNADNGYDIRDYRAIMKEFGTMRDFEVLLGEAHRRGLRLILDLVVNHTSDEHAWFRESRQTPVNKYRDYYFWRDGRDGKEPNNWGSQFGGPAWKYDESVKKYYLHLFSEKQPDLNWENPEVRRGVYGMAEWWLKKGIDGFRMDVINAISKDPHFPDGEILPGGKYASGWKYVTNGPRVHEFLKEMNREVFSRYNIMTVGETDGVTTEDALRYAGSNEHELSMVLQFEHVNLGSDGNGKWNDIPVPFSGFKEVIDRWQTRLDGKAWNSLYLENHDQPRSVSRFGDDGRFRKESAKMLATLLLTLQGTPFLYQGEEIGMTNAAFDSIDSYRDIETLHAYKDWMERNPADREHILRSIRAKSRDNARTPMQWDGSENAGFTAGTPWITLNPNYREINVEESVSDPDSVLNYYKRLISIRRKNPVFVYGKYIPLPQGNSRVLCYMRKLEGQTLLVLLNFDGVPAAAQLPEEISGGKLLISNYGGDPNPIRYEAALRPYEADVYRL